MRCVQCKKTIQQDSLFCKYCGSQQPVKPSPITEKKFKRSPNGSGYAYKRGNSWYIRYRKYVGVVSSDSQKLQCIQRTKGGFKTKAEALAYLPNLSLTPKSSQELTVAYYWSVYTRDSLPKLSRSKQVNYKTAYERLKPLWPVRVSDLTVAQLRQVAAPYTTFYPVNDIRSVLQRIFDLACADNPSINNALPSFIVLPEKHEKEQTAFTTEEVQAIYQSYQDGNAFAGYILLMVYTSMMPGEFLKLRKQMFDLPNRRIIGAGIKTKQRKKADILIPEFLVPIIQHLMSLSDDPDRFHGYNYYEKFASEFKNTLEICGCRPMTPYACRHTTQTILGLDPSTSAAARAAVMRHSIREEDRYSHTESAFARQASDQMPAPDQLSALKRKKP